MNFSLRAALTGMDLPGVDDRGVVLELICRIAYSACLIMYIT